MTTIYCDKAALPERRENDHYPTDEGTVRRILGRYGRMPGLNLSFQHPRTVLDPGAGSGAFGRVVRDLWPQARLTGVELRDVSKPAGYDLWLNEDFVAQAPCIAHRFDLIAGNPPYRRAEEFVRAALPLLAPEGHLIFLLRLAFLEGQGRRDGLFTEHGLKACWVCSRRPSFQADGKSNATAFAAFVWQQGWLGATRLGWLGDR